jgi:hypothetical protein
LIASLRRLFDGSMIMPLDPKPDATPSPAPAEPAVEAPVRMQLVRVAPEPVAELVPALEPEPVAAMAPAPEPVPAMAPSSPEPVAAVAPVPEPVAEAPRPAPAQPPVARPKRKRPNPPTNKDMLKQTLSVLKKVEERLGQLEHEVSVIDGAVRKVVSSSDESGEPAAVGE